MKRWLWIIGSPVALVALYVIGVLIHGTLHDWQPVGTTELTTYREADAQRLLPDTNFSVLSWNVGYGALGSEADFFIDAGHRYVDGGHMVHSPSDHVETYVRGIRSSIASTLTDFTLLQEVDSLSDRSHGRLLLAELAEARGEAHVDFAPNYINERVPVPLFQPWRAYGQVYSGLSSMSRYAVKAAERHSLPGDFPWPDRLFQLDRCVLVQRLRTASGRLLTLINLHLSAYDSDGSVKAAQLEYVAHLAKAEYAAGREVVLGGDWNLVPPNFPYDRFISDPKSEFVKRALPMDYPDQGWTVVYDARLPTNRDLAAPYLRDSSFVSVIDYFVISPGLQAVRARTINQDFAWSDHHPVYVELAWREDEGPSVEPAPRR